MNAKICTDVFKKIIKTKPKQFTLENGHEELIHLLGDYELFIEIGPNFQVDYQVRMVVTHDPHKIGINTTGGTE